MHDITIPLMGFNGFHHVSDYESKDDFEDFIGREGVLDKFKAWLEDSEEKRTLWKFRMTRKKYSGAYLITGFRGMGKSSFVYKAILDVKKKAKTHRLKNCYYVPISINVGNDLLTSKELLYIICKLLSSAFNEKTRWKHNYRCRLNLLIPQVLTTCLLIWLFFCGNTISLSVDTFLDRFTNCISSLITHLPSDIRSLSHWNLDTVSLLKCLFFIIATFVIGSLWRYIYYALWKLTDCNCFITTWQIKRVFRFINERIDSETTVQTENRVDLNTSMNNPGIDKLIHKSGYRYRKIKKHVYPIAQTAEIQDLLVSQLRLIKYLWTAKFRFIFIIDELDKVSPEDDEKEIIPEYEYTNSTKGNSSHRSRQKALASLLVNMKYFISSSEAKFVFITGYDMYEATLADISNREFNIHSIFNGYINVSSFLRKTGKNQGADSMIEEYFCHTLLGKNDCINGKCIREDLHDYANYYRNQWINLGITNSEPLEMLLERRINFLRHFLTYLFYMSNGSPKKLAMYLEKYVRSKDRIESIIKSKYHGTKLIKEKQDIALGLKNLWTDCNWFLYFDVRNIQKIEFINYLIYPMIKNLIIKSSIYNDKLLISTSFMISNLYKFHKSGFSWRNLEYMPELLDINKTPELRDFIGGILQFLNQTHIDEAVANLYQFKFPQRLSEEITFFSKNSEEISYLFNFSHDELLSIKTLYNKQLDHYTNEKFESPAIASLRHLLGDIYILEENYEQAIFEFNEALAAIHRQERAYNVSDGVDASNVLFRIRVNLKLGLAYEKRKTFDTAYITYENLVAMIVEMARFARYTSKSSNLACHLFDIIDIHKSHSSFFSNIRLTYLGILAKLSVVEKMDLGGIQENDIIKLIKEFNPIESKLKDDIRSIAIMDFYTKFGDILYYKNCRDFRDPSWTIHHLLSEMLNLQSDLDKSKLTKCKDEDTDLKSNVDKLTPCIACRIFNKSIHTCVKDLGGSDSDQKTSKALFFLKKFHGKENASSMVYKKGNLFLRAMANALTGLGNTLLGCSKVKDIDISPFFFHLNKVYDFPTTYIEDIENDIVDYLSPYTKSILYYLAAADTYELVTDFKAAYNMYVQIIDAITVYYKAVWKKKVPKSTLKFCDTLTRKAIYCAYLHYDSINYAEVDTIKHELAKKHIDYINLHTLTVFPELEVTIDKYYQICLMGDSDMRDNVLKKVLNSRQIGSYKLISTLSQNIQNLCFKVAVNEEIFFRIFPKLRKSFTNYDLDIGLTISSIVDFYCEDFSSFELNKLISVSKWDFLDMCESINDKKFILLDYLLIDSLYCLNMITELIEPLYSTTLYSNSFIGDVYIATFIWNHILICIREIFEYAETDRPEAFFEEFKNRYKVTRKQLNFISLSETFKKSRSFLIELPSWKNYSQGNLSRVEYIYKRITTESGNFLTSSYLAGNALNRYLRAIEMHTSGKTYKEMMSTLFFLEDDMHNDSNYLNLAIERFLINQGFIQNRIDTLKRFMFKDNSLLIIDNYYTQ